MRSRNYLCKINNFINTKHIVILLAILLNGCSFGFPEQDCGTVADITIDGEVVNSQGISISDANVLVTSIENNCTNGMQIEEIEITSNTHGRFQFMLPFISEGDVIELRIESSGYGTYSVVGTYTMFEDYLIIELFEQR